MVIPSSSYAFNPCLPCSCLWRNADVATLRLPLPTSPIRHFLRTFFLRFSVFGATLTLSLTRLPLTRFHHSMGMSTGPVFSAFQKRRVQGLGGRGHLFSLLCTAIVSNALFLLYLFIFVLFSLLWRKQKVSKKTVVYNHTRSATIVQLYYIVQKHYTLPPEETRRLWRRCVCVCAFCFCFIVFVIGVSMMASLVACRNRQKKRAKRNGTNGILKSR